MAGVTATRKSAVAQKIVTGSAAAPEVEHVGGIGLYRNPGWLIPMHRHEVLEFDLVVSGSATYLVAGQKYRIYPDTLVWLFPDQDHALLDLSPDYSAWLGHFQPDWVRRTCVSASARPLCARLPASAFCKQIPKAQSARLVALMRDLTEKKIDRAQYNAGLGYILLAAWAAHLESDHTPEGVDLHPAIERAAQFLRQNPQGLSLEALAKRCGVSASRLSRLFKEQMGVSLVEYRNRHRIEYFLRIYGQGRRLSLVQAALEAGFGSYPQFHRVFKSMLGYAPSELRHRFGNPPRR